MKTSTCRRLLATGGLAVVLGVTNLIAAPRLKRPASAAWNLAATGTVLTLGRWAGADRQAIGLDRLKLHSGLVTGVVGSALIAALMAGATTTTTGRELLDDDRVVRASWPQTGMHVGVYIPLGTVLFEEVAFRGVLPALLDPEGRSIAVSMVVPAVAFGAWHIVSSRDFVAAHGADREHSNDPTHSDGATGSVTGIVAATTAGGLLLAHARRQGQHLIAPALMHFTCNSLATVLGKLVGHQRRRR